MVHGSVDESRKPTSYVRPVLVLTGVVSQRKPTLPLFNMDSANTNAISFDTLCMLNMAAHVFCK